jgi:hypothetical protein
MSAATAARVVAALIAFLAWIGLFVQFGSTWNLRMARFPACPSNKTR